jgi:hypothetical protein
MAEINIGSHHSDKDFALAPPDLRTANFADAA